MEKLQLGRKRKTDAEKPRMDPLMRALKALHSAGSPETMTPEELEHQRRNQEILGRLTAPMAGMEYEEFSIGTMPAAWTRLKAPHGDRRVILYCHGGGYTSGNLGYSRVLSSKLAHVTGYDVLSFEYRLAPEHPYPAAVEDAMRAWDYLMYQGYGAENVTVAGDSAGGNLALVLCRRLKAAGRRMPRALLLMSPWTDMTMSGASYRERVESDPMLTPEYIEAVRRAYAGDRDLHDPDLSPLLGDLGNFPPTLIQVGDHEILYSDSASLAAALRAAHVPCRLEVSEGMWHVFQMFPIRKATAATQTASFVSSSTSDNMRSRQLEFKQEIDVRGMRADEALQAVSYFIDDAVQFNIKQIRILHGTGYGILRQRIREYLNTVPDVKSYRDEHVQFGGAGITVVELS